MVLRAIMRTWSDVTKAYSAAAMSLSLSQESSTRVLDKAPHRVLAYVRLRAFCSLRTHVRTVTFRRFTRRMNIRIIPLMKSVETILQSRDSHLFESVNSPGLAFHAFTRAFVTHRKERGGEGTHRSSVLIMRKANLRSQTSRFDRLDERDTNL